MKKEFETNIQDSLEGIFYEMNNIIENFYDEIACLEKQIENLKEK